MDGRRRSPSHGSPGRAETQKSCRPDDQEAQQFADYSWDGGIRYARQVIPQRPPKRAEPAPRLLPDCDRGASALPLPRWRHYLPLQDVFLMIRRHKTTIFTDAKESSTVFELKRIVEGILKRPPDEQRLYKDDQLLDDGKTLGECGFTSQTARPQAPATVGLAFRADDAFEALRIEPFSSPPELPDVMKPQDSGSSANEQAVQ
ncbi:elongin-B [Herpailurus yagouaroundi]|uniref:elongin-B n=1 Tax=Herpailurus yagouaroundi TaxID=1608482 RepID=UPI001AD614EB|nr:elongin-B [Puma yagouaroundi]